MGLSRFHDIEPQSDLGMGPSGRLSAKVAQQPRGVVPFPNLTDNTLVLSDMLLLAHVDGQLHLQLRHGPLHCQGSSCSQCRIFCKMNSPQASVSRINRAVCGLRVGDSYPNNMLEVHVRAYLYRWRSRTTKEGDVMPYQVTPCQHALCLRCLKAV